MQNIETDQRNVVPFPVREEPVARAKYVRTTLQAAQELIEASIQAVGPAKLGAKTATQKKRRATTVQQDLAQKQQIEQILQVAREVIKAGIALLAQQNLAQKEQLKKRGARRSRATVKSFDRRQEQRGLQR